MPALGGGSEWFNEPLGPAELPRWSHMREMEPTNEHRRRWFHMRPEPRRRMDFWGFNSTWWMTVVWLVVIVVAVAPFPWW
jgi:hypothetical protein